MKKQVLILLSLLVPFLGSAQIRGDNLQLGFTATPTLGWISVNGQEDGAPVLSNDGIRIGVSYGILADIGFARNYYFSTAFTISSINGKTQSKSIDGGYASTVYKLRYIEIPLTLKLKSNPGETSRFYGQFGLGTGVKIGAKAGIGSQDVNISSDVNNVRFSLIAGAGTEWNINRNLNILTGVTFNNGFTRVIDGGRPDIKNSYIALNLGVFF